MPSRTPSTLLALAAVGLAACSGTDVAAEPSAYQVVGAATLEPGDPVPVPVGEPILTLTGVLATNVGDTLQFDLDTLESIGLVQYDVDDQQAEGAMVTFTGVLLNDVLEIAGLPTGVTTLHTIALNDYAIEIPLEDPQTYPVMLATSVDGERMPVDRFGPVRVVYPYESYTFDVATYDPRWIWQLASIDVR